MRAHEFRNQSQFHGLGCYYLPIAQPELRATSSAQLLLRHSPAALMRLRILLVAALVLLTAAVHAQTFSQSQQLQEAIHLMETKGDYAAAIKVFDEVAKGADRNLNARALLYLGLCYERVGKEIARRKYQQLIDEFADQPKLVAEARARMAALKSEDAPSLTFRKVHEWSEPETTGVPSPDGRSLSYVDSDLHRVAILDLASGETRFLTPPQHKSKGAREYPLSSIFSPDGSEMAFGHLTADRVASLQLIDVTTLARRTLFSDPTLFRLYAEDWSADGRHILATLCRKGTERANELAVFTVSDGAMRILQTFDWRCPRKASFSPDSRWVVFDLPPSEENPRRDIYLIGADGNGLTPLVEHPADDLLLGWTPDGGQVWFASDRTGSLDLWAVPMADGKSQRAPELIKRDLGRIAPMAFTARGSFFYGIRSGLHDIQIASLDPATGLPVSEPISLGHRWVGSNRTAAWSRDGRKLAYISDRDEEFRLSATRFLIIRDVESGEERELWPKLSNLNYLRLSWSADGRSILATGYDQKQRHGIFRIDIQTGAVTPLHSSPEAWFFQANSIPGETAVVYSIHDYPGKAFRIVRRELSSGAEQVLFQTGLDLWGHFDLSTDGRWVVFTAVDTVNHDHSLKLVPADGGGVRELYRIPKPEYALDVTWMPNGKYVLFAKVKSGPGAMTELWRIPVTGGEPQNLGITMDLMPHINVSPDGLKIACTGGMLDKGEVWEIENYVAATENKR